MTMPDRIRDSVQAAVDQPVNADELLRRVRSGTERRSWPAPLAAAAAVVLLAGGAGVVLQDRSRPTGPAAGGVVPFVQQEPSEADVPSPELARPIGSLPGSGPCATQTVTPSIAWTATPSGGNDLRGLARIRLADGERTPCTLGTGDPRLVLLGPADGAVGPASTAATQPEVPLPPRTPGRVVDPERAVLIPLTLSGSNCVPSNFGTLSGMEPVLPEILFDGDKLPCDSSRPQADGTLTLGLPRTEGVPAGLLPQDRQALNINLDVPEPAQEGEPLRYLVRLSNPTTADITLSPCPAYQAVFSRRDSSGTTEWVTGGRLNCQAAPDAVPAGGDVAFEMIQADLQSGQPGTKDATEVSLRWGIAGPKAATARTPLKADEFKADQPSEEDGGSSEKGNYKLQYTGPVLIDGGAPDPQAESLEDMKRCLALPGVQNVVEGVKLPANFRLDVVGSQQQEDFEACAAAINDWLVVDTATEKTFIIRPDNVPDVKKYASDMTVCLNLGKVGATSITEQQPLSYVAYAADRDVDDLQQCLDDVAGADIEVQPGAPGNSLGLQEFIDRCVGQENAAPGPDSEYIGLTEEQVNQPALERDGAPRVVGRDRVCLDRTDDRQPDRVNVIIDADRVVWAGRF